MSRFVEILHGEREISVESFRGMLRTMTERLEADTGHIEMSFPFFVMKRAPVSGVESLMDYRASLIGEHRHGHTEMWVRVSVPVTSLCPCSKNISDYGAHNQRSHVTITAKLRSHMWIEELIEIAESEASCELYGILKRPDEKYVTERAYDNPKFVEDMVRDVATRLNLDARVAAYLVESRISSPFTTTRPTRSSSTTRTPEGSGAPGTFRGPGLPCWPERARTRRASGAHEIS